MDSGKPTPGGAAAAAVAASTYEVNTSYLLDDSDIMTFLNERIRSSSIAGISGFYNGARLDPLLSRVRKLEADVKAAAVGSSASERAFPTVEVLDDDIVIVGSAHSVVDVATPGTLAASSASSVSGASALTPLSLRAEDTSPPSPVTLPVAHAPAAAASVASYRLAYSREEESSACAAVVVAAAGGAGELRSEGRVTRMLALLPAVCNSSISQRGGLCDERGSLRDTDVVSIKIGYYLDRAYQGEVEASSVDSRRDVVEELMAGFLYEHMTDASIFVPFNIANNHWTTIHLDIKKTRDTEGSKDKFLIKVNYHDPYVHTKQLNEKVYEEITAILDRRLKAYLPEAVIKFENVENNKDRPRQSPEDATSCGVICAFDIISLIETGHIPEAAMPYSVGARELRLEMAKTIKTLRVSTSGSTKPTPERKVSSIGYDSGLFGAAGMMSYEFMRQGSAALSSIGYGTMAAGATRRLASTAASPLGREATAGGAGMASYDKREWGSANPAYTGYNQSSISGTKRGPSILRELEVPESLQLFKLLMETKAEAKDDESYHDLFNRTRDSFEKAYRAEKAGYYYGVGYASFLIAFGKYDEAIKILRDSEKADRSLKNENLVYNKEYSCVAHPCIQEMLTRSPEVKVKVKFFGDFLLCLALLNTASKDEYVGKIKSLYSSLMSNRGAPSVRELCEYLSKEAVKKGVVLGLELDAVGGAGGIGAAISAIAEAGHLRSLHQSTMLSSAAVRSVRREATLSSLDYLTEGWSSGIDVDADRKLSPETLIRNQEEIELAMAIELSKMDNTAADSLPKR